METAILNVLLFMIIAVAGFGILAIFYMIVVEKTRDIGILKSLGASGRGIMGIFLAYGLSLGLVGSGVGMVVGLLFVRYINPIADGLGWLTGHPVFNPAIYYFYKIPDDRRSRRPWPGSWPGRWPSRCWPACCRPAAPPGCTPWRPCAMNELDLRADSRLAGDAPIAAQGRSPRACEAARRRPSSAPMHRRRARAGPTELPAIDLHKSYRKGPVECPCSRA